MSTFKHTPVYVASGAGGFKKVGEIEETTWSIKSNGEQVVTEDEVAESTGVLTAEASLGAVLPFAGMSVDLDALVIGQTPVKLGYGPVAGKFIEFSGKLIQVDGSSTVRTGVTKGKYMFRGGSVKRV